MLGVKGEINNVWTYDTYLSASAPLGDHLNVRVGVNNVADKNPPLILNGTLSDCPNTSCNDNTWVGTYDTLGRYIFFNVTATF